MGPSRMKKFLAIAGRLLISGLLLWLLFREHSGKILPHLSSLVHQWQWTAAGLLCAGVSVFLSAWRWWVVLRPQVPAARFGDALHATFVAGFFNITSLGTIGGDAYRVIAIKQRHPGTAAGTGMSIVVDHIAGVLATAVLFFGLGIVALYQWPDNASGIRSVLVGFTLFFVLASIGMVGSVLTLSPPFLRWAGRISPRLVNLPFVQKTAHTFDPLWSSWRASLLAVAISLVMSSLYFASFYCGLRAVGGEAPLLSVLMAMPIVDVAAALPISVSGLGVREKTFETLMAVFVGLPEATSVLASLAGWLFTVCWGLLGGLLFVSRSRKQ